MNAMHRAYATQRRLALALAVALLLPAPALLAQESGEHTTHQHGTTQTPEPETKPDTDSTQSMQGMDHSKMDHSKMDHSKMDHSKMDHSKMDHSKMGHSMESMQHDMSSMQDSSAGHAGHHPDASYTPVSPPTDSDRAAAVPPAHGHPFHDNRVHSYFLLDGLEAWDGDDGTAWSWSGQGWVGTDLDRLWLRSDGERVSGHTESAELELLYGRAISTWWDVVAGLRHDFAPGDAQSQDFLAVGIQGLAPQKFDVEATAYLGEHGQSALRVEADYELLLSNRLILQPRLEADVYGKDDPARGIGSGLATAELGLRLRYEFTRKFAPYVGLVHERAFGDTAELRRADSKAVDDTRIVLGIRTWF